MLSLYSVFDRIGQTKFDNVKTKFSVKYFDIFVCKIKRMN